MECSDLGLAIRFVLYLLIKRKTFFEAGCVVLAGQTPGGFRVVLDFSLLLSLHQGKESKEQLKPFLLHKIPRNNY